MGTYRAADLVQLDDLQRRFLDEAAAVASLRARITTTLEATLWTGPAAERFRERWRAEFTPALQRLEEALGQNGAVVAARRQAIDAATGITG